MFCKKVEAETKKEHRQKVEQLKSLISLTNFPKYWVWLVQHKRANDFILSTLGGRAAKIAI